MKRRTFEQYLIEVGDRYDDATTLSIHVIMDNVEWFRECYNRNIGAYKACLFLTLEEQEHLIKDYGKG